MGKSLDSIICISKNIFDKILMITNNSSDLCIDDSNDKYLIESSIYNNVIKDFEKILKEKERELKQDIKGVDYSKYNSLKEEYETIKYKIIRDKFNKANSKKNSEEDLLELSIKIYEEVNSIMKIPYYIQTIKEELKEIKDNDLSSNIESYIVKYKQFINDGASLEDYINLKKELDLIIKKTYTSKVNSTLLDGKEIYLVKDSNEIKILDTADLNGFTYGYIYSSDSIKCVKNKDNPSFVSFNSVDYESYNIELDEDNPIAIYAVTYGEGNINPNYNAATNLVNSKNLPFIEFDKTLKMKPTNYSYRELINNLLIDKGLHELVNKDMGDEFYSKFNTFFDEFRKLKLSQYSEGNVINLFEFYFNIIFSQRYLDLDNALNITYSVEQIKEIFERNVYYDFNIFRNIKVSKRIIKTFMDKFYNYRYNKRLNDVYHGIDIILDELHNATEERLEEIISIINSSPCRDSWLIANNIKPIHKVAKVTKLDSNYTTINFETPANDDKPYYSLKAFLQTYDGVAR